MGRPDCRCRRRHACILCVIAGHTSTVHPPHPQDKITSSRPNVIMTVDRVAAQQHGTVVVRSAKAKIGSLVIG
jgi:hypothetical protein